MTSRPCGDCDEDDCHFCNQPGNVSKPPAFTFRAREPEITTPARAGAFQPKAVFSSAEKQRIQALFNGGQPTLSQQPAPTNSAPTANVWRPKQTTRSPANTFAQTPSYEDWTRQQQHNGASFQSSGPTDMNIDY